MAVLKNCSEDFHLMFISLLNWNNNSNGMIKAMETEKLRYYYQMLKKGMCHWSTFGRKKDEFCQNSWKIVKVH